MPGLLVLFQGYVNFGNRDELLRSQVAGAGIDFLQDPNTILRLLILVQAGIGDPEYALDIYELCAIEGVGSGSRPIRRPYAAVAALAAFAYSP